MAVDWIRYEDGMVSLTDHSESSPRDRLTNGIQKKGVNIGRKGYTDNQSDLTGLPTLGETLEN